MSLESDTCVYLGGCEEKYLWLRWWRRRLMKAVWTTGDGERGTHVLAWDRLKLEQRAAAGLLPLHLRVQACVLLRVRKTDTRTQRGRVIHVYDFLQNGKHAQPSVLGAAASTYATLTLSMFRNTREWSFSAPLVFQELNAGRVCNSHEDIQPDPLLWARCICLHWQQWIRPKGRYWWSSAPQGGIWRIRLAEIDICGRHRSFICKYLFR